MLVDTTHEEVRIMCPNSPSLVLNAEAKDKDKPEDKDKDKYNRPVVSVSDNGSTVLLLGTAVLVLGPAGIRAAAYFGRYVRVSR